MYYQEHLMDGERERLLTQRDEISKMSLGEIRDSLRTSRRWGIAQQIIAGSVMGVALADLLMTGGSSFDKARMTVDAMGVIFTGVMFDRFYSQNQDRVHLLSQALKRQKKLL